MKFKTVKCPACGLEFRVQLKEGGLELKNGWHGECPGHNCWYWYFEDLIDNIHSKQDTREVGLKAAIL